MKTTAFIDVVKSGQFQAQLEDLYPSESIAHEQTRYISMAENFVKNFGDEEIHVYSAPGRSEVGGNHTDHQHGRVLAAAVNLDNVAIVSKRDDNKIHIISEGFEIPVVDIRNTEIVESEKATSAALIRGICDRIKQLGFKVQGFNAYMTSEVLEGAGLSSSAAFEVLVGTILSYEYNEGNISAVEIAKIGQYSENHYFMKPCGLMDQMASSVGGFITIDFKDVNEPVIEKIDFDFETSNHVLCIVDTKGSHADLTADYAAIPSEMKAVANYFGKQFLREVDVDTFYKEIANVRKVCDDRSVLRAMHFFTENERVVDQVNALKQNNFETFKDLIIDSGNSSAKYLQNIYAKVNEQNIMLALAMSEVVLKGVGAYRVHGGGFAGTIQAFVPSEKLDSYKAMMESVFGKGSCHVLHIRKHGGIRVI